jgi:hypothetical protein
MSTFDLRALPDLDLMVDLKRIAGFRPGLDNCCAATFQAKKSGGGLQSLQWWREGREDEVIEYCKQDVLLTRRLHEFGAQTAMSNASTGRGACAPQCRLVARPASQPNRSKARCF